VSFTGVCFSSVYFGYKERRIVKRALTVDSLSTLSRTEWSRISMSYFVFGVHLSMMPA